MNKAQEEFMMYLREKVGRADIELGNAAAKSVFKENIEKGKFFDPVFLDNFLKAFSTYCETRFGEIEAKILNQIALLNIEKVKKEHKSKQKKKYKIRGKFFYIGYLYLLDIAHKQEKRKMVEENKMWHMYEQLISLIEGKSNELFIDFERLSNELMSSPLSTQSQADMIFSTIELNLEILKKGNVAPILDREKAKQHKFKYITKSQLRNLFKCEEVELLLASPLRRHKKRKKELQQFIEENPLDISSTIEKFKIIQEHYTNPSDLTDENIKTICNTLIELKIEPKVCYKIEANLQKRKKKSQKQTKEILPTQKRLEKPTLSKKEMNLIIKELDQYFDFSKMRAIRALSLDETIYCIQLLTKTSADTKVIEQFLQEVESENRRENPIRIYVDMYDKLITYKEQYEIGGIMTNIEQDLQKIFICSKEEYHQIKLSIAENMKYILNKIGHDFQYEKDKAKIKSEQ